MYLPSDDSVLLANCLKDYSGNFALDIGAGSGIITHALCENFEHVVGTDIVFEMLRNCKKDAVSHT
ncbi:MAG: methyltransferase domain-containing protein, partial [Thermoproteota archaeon]|nr:methyltransferase domain-containing protein [Thermoproteota archaeon]